MHWGQIRYLLSRNATLNQQKKKKRDRRDDPCTKMSLFCEGLRRDCQYLMYPCVVCWALLFPSSQRNWSAELNPLWACSLVRCPSCLHFWSKVHFLYPNSLCRWRSRTHTVSRGWPTSFVQTLICSQQTAKHAGLRLTEETSTNSFVIARAQPGQGLCPLQTLGFLTLYFMTW